MKCPVCAVSYALFKAKVPCAEEIAMMLCREINHVHIASEPVEENRVEATHEAEGSYDTVVYCADCGEELSRTTTTLPMRKLKGYLYNGVLLPALHADAYQYAVWGKSSSGPYTLFTTKHRLYAGEIVAGGTDALQLVNPSPTSTQRKHWYNIKEGALYYSASYSSSGYVNGEGFVNALFSAETLIWSNYDIYMASGQSGDYTATDTLYFPKSPDPIPVYE